MKGKYDHAKTKIDAIESSIATSATGIPVSTSARPGR